MIDIYCDGSCKGNPGPGRFGVVVLDSATEDLIESHTDAAAATTNNREELKAILWALNYIDSDLLDYTDEIVIYSDSAYVVNICNDWMFSWSKNGWMNSKKQKVLNYDLIKEIYDRVINIARPIYIKKCEGHANVYGNELADVLAQDNPRKFSSLLMRR